MKKNIIALTLIGLVAASAVGVAGVEYAKIGDLHRTTAAQQRSIKTQQRSIKATDARLADLSTQVQSLNQTTTSDDIIRLKKQVGTLQTAASKVCDDKLVSNRIAAIEGAESASNASDFTYWIDQQSTINAICGTDN